MRYGWSFLIISLLTSTVYSQNYIPYEIWQAIEKGTRTLTGSQGPNYFQNHAVYDMNVRFDPSSGMLSGVADIMYYNESPDSLHKIVMRLYQNIYKKGGIRDDEVNPGVIHNGVTIKALSVNNNDYTSKITHHTRTEGTNFTIYLHNTLDPGKSCQIRISWEFQMPGQPMKRYGKYDDGSYFIGLWYPQVAVYDDIDGWDEIQYTGTHEFYNDFNDYYVSVTVPRGFMVWATGSWINAEYILSKTVWERYREASGSEEIIHIITAGDLKNKSWYSGRGAKTFRFKAENIPDFAFAVSDRYIWDATTALFNSGQNQNMVLVSVAYPEGATYFDEVALIGQKIVRHLSESSYGIPYPFKAVTVFKGEGGMEYPMLVNNGTRFFLDATIFLTLHEVAHAYFPFLLGINERKYSWIDEGLTTFLPMETEKALGSEYYTTEHIVRRYNFLAGTDNDIPLSVPAYQTRGVAYDNYSYVRSSMAFYMFENYVGRDTFRMAIRNFTDKWHNKHPTPYDFFAEVSNTSNRDLDWFIDLWFFESGWPDLAIGKVTQTGNKIKIEILKKGSFPVPVFIELQFLNGETEQFSIHPEVWKNNDTLSLSFLIIDELENIRLGNEKIPDKYPLNNIFNFPENYE